MSNKSIFKTPIKHATLQRNAFDLSRRDVFSCNAGELIPVVSLEVNPNEHFEIRPDIFLRTQSLNTAAYCRAKQNIEFFFVPYRALWSKADQFFTGSNFTASSIFNNVVPTLAPRFPLTPSELIGKPTDCLYNWLYYYSNEFNGSSKPELPASMKDIFGHSKTYQTRKLLDMLGYGLVNFKQYTDEESQIGPSSQAVWKGQYATIFRLAAYQKIYQDYFRLSLYEPYDNGCNIDDLQGTGATSSITIPINDDFINRFATLRFAAWKSDYFTNLRASANLYMSLWMSDMSLDANLGNLYPKPLTSGTKIEQSPDKGVFIRQSVFGSSSPFSFDLNVSSIRALYAIERMVDSMSRAKDGTYSAQIEARFGVKPLIDPHLSCTYLGGSDAPVMIGEVTSTAQTTDVAGGSSGDLGRVAGKGTSQSSNKTITFTAKEHGIIMGIFYIQPEAEYSAFGVDALNQKFQREEYFTPELDKLGFAPVTLKEFGVTGSILQIPQQSSKLQDNNVLGFNPMYSEYKTAVDKCHGDFVQNGSLSAWTTPRILIDFFRSIQDNSGLSLDSLRVNPATMDSVFAVQSTEADQFIVNCWHDIRAIRPMSINGLPYCN